MKRKYNIKIAVINNKFLNIIFKSVNEARSYIVKNNMRDVSPVRILNLKRDIKCPKCDKNIWTKGASFCPFCATKIS